MEPKSAALCWVSVMTPRRTAKKSSNLEPTLSTGAGAPMTAEQRTALRQLAYDAFEPDAFSQTLTQREASLRIAMLQAKLKLQDEPPHTL